MFKNSLTWNYIKKFKWKSEFIKYMFITLLTIEIPFFILSYIIFNYSNSSSREEMFSEFRNTAFLNSDYIDSQLSDVFLKSNSLINEKEIIAFANTTNKYPNTKSAITETSNAYKALNSYFGTSNFISSASILNSYNDIVISLYSESGLYKNINDKTSYEKFVQTNNGNYIDTNKNLKQKYTINISKEIPNNNANKSILVVNIDLDTITRAVSGNMDTESMYYLVYNNKIICSNDDTIVGTIIDDGHDFEVLVSQNKLTEIKNKKQYIISIPMENPGFSFIKKTPVPHMSKNLYVFIIVELLLLLFAITISFFVSIKYYTKIAQTLSVISHSTLTNEAFEQDEFYYITEMISNLIKKEKRISDNLTEKISALKDAQTNALQCQINPHFIHNTLQIVSLNLNERTEEKNLQSQKIISLLAEITRYIMDTKNNIIAFEDELLYAKKYLEIQSIRFSNSFYVIYDIDHVILNCRVLKFILQPILENAVTHGISQNSGSISVIKLSAEKNDNRLIISITDNGPGFAPEKLEQIKKEISSGDYTVIEKNIGIINVNQRIKLMYGNEYGVKIQSAPGETTITLELPRNNI